MPERNGRDDNGARSRALWSGTLTFGLVSVPVELYPAQRSEHVALRMLAPDGTPLSRRYFCPEEEREIGWDEIVRGYELDGRYVIVTDEELEALEPRKSRDIDLRLFVERDAIDPLHFDRAWYLAPGGGSTKAYRLLAEVMQRTDRAGIATFVMRTKEYLVAIVAENGLLRAETLRFADEVRSAADVGLPDDGKVKPADVKRFQRQIRELERDDIAASELEDQDAKRLLGRIEQKRRRGEDIVETDMPAETHEEEEGVIDLMEILKRRMQRKDGAGTDSRRGSARTRQRRSRGRSGADLESKSKKELYARAQELDIEGRSGMNKAELIDAIRRSA